MLGEVVEQLASYPETRVAGMDRHLIDVKVVVDDIGDEVADRSVGGIGGDPDMACLVVAGEYVQRKWFVVGYLWHTDVAEAFPAARSMSCRTGSSA
jgi:hypothetical protein